MSSRNYQDSNMEVSFFKRTYDNDRTALLFGNTYRNGYPIAEVLQAVAYVIADETELFGKRPKGYYQIIERHLSSNPLITVEVRIPDLLTPLVIAGNGRGSLIGAKNPEVYNRLISRDPVNEYKVIVRPISEEDLRNA